DPARVLIPVGQQARGPDAGREGAAYLRGAGLAGGEGPGGARVGGLEQRQPLAVGGQLLRELASLPMPLQRDDARRPRHAPHRRLAVVPGEVVDRGRGAYVSRGEDEELA